VGAPGQGTSLRFVALRFNSYEKLINLRAREGRVTEVV
jgi:hypothetical protein